MCELPRAEKEWQGRTGVGRVGVVGFLSRRQVQLHQFVGAVGDGTHGSNVGGGVGPRLHLVLGLGVLFVWGCLSAAGKGHAHFTCATT